MLLTDEQYTIKEVVTDLKKIKLLETKLDQIQQSLNSKKLWIWNFLAILLAGVISSIISLL